MCNNNGIEITKHGFIVNDEYINLRKIESIEVVDDSHDDKKEFHLRFISKDASVLLDALYFHGTYTENLDALAIIQKLGEVKNKTLTVEKVEK